MPESSRGMKRMSAAKRLRRPVQGGYARGDETRLRIIAAAIDLFGERGFAAASTREIAVRAGVNAPALQYYFENKEGLYRACAEHIAGVVWALFEPVVQHAREVLAQPAPPTTELIDAFVAIQETHADKISLSPATPGQRLFVAREQSGQEPAVASEVLQEQMREPLNRVGAELVGRICGIAPDDPVTVIRLLSLHGQLMAFHAVPRTVLSLLGWNEIDEARCEFIKSTVRTQTRALLEIWSGERDAAKHTRKPAAAARAPTESSLRIR